MGARSSVENLVKEELLEKKFLAASLPAATPRFFAMKLEDNADSALYPRRRKKVANAVILIAKMLKVSEYLLWVKTFQIRFCCQELPALHCTC
jgi:hypothetical protein